MKVPVPFPFTPRDKAYKLDVPDAALRESIRNARRCRIPLSLLRATQRTVDGDRLAQYLIDPNIEPHSNTPGKRGGDPIIVAHNGELYIHNGTHRSTRKLLMGEQYVDARFAHASPPPPRAFGRPGGVYMLRPDFDMTAVQFDAHDVEDVAYMIDGGIAVICIDGPLEDKPGGAWWSYFDDYESILCRFRNAIESDDVRGVLLKFDSPGGNASGLNECVDAMLRAKAKSGKPVWCYSDEGAYSAAYALALTGDRIFLPRAGGVGSIGVISRLYSQSDRLQREGFEYRVYVSGKRKADGDPNLPISPGAERRVQRRVDQLARMYWKLAAERRGMSVDAVRALEADTFYGKDAVRKGLADGVHSLEGTIRRFRETLDRTTQDRVPSGTSGARAARQPSATEERHHGMNPLQKRVNECAAKLASAKTDDEKKKWQSRLNKANEALAAALDAATVRSGKHYKKTEQLDESHSSTGGSSTGGSSMEGSESHSSTGGSSTGGSSEEEEEEESAAGETEERALVALVHRITGQKSAKGAIGALLAMHNGKAAADKTAKRVARLEAERASDRVEKLIAQGKADRKITPGNEAECREIAKKHGTSALKAFLKAASPAVLEELEPGENAEGANAPKISAEDRKAWTKLGIPEDMWPQMAAHQAQRDKQRAGAAGAVTRGAPHLTKPKK